MKLIILPSGCLPWLLQQGCRDVHRKVSLRGFRRYTSRSPGKIADSIADFNVKIDANNGLFQVQTRAHNFLLLDGDRVSQSQDGLVYARAETRRLTKESGKNNGLHWRTEDVRGSQAAHLLHVARFMKYTGQVDCNSVIRACRHLDPTRFYDLITGCSFKIWWEFPAVAQLFLQVFRDQWAKV